jgi:hypothetical protein
MSIANSPWLADWRTYADETLMTPGDRRRAEGIIRRATDDWAGRHEKWYRDRFRSNRARRNGEVVGACNHLTEELIRRLDRRPAGRPDHRSSGVNALAQHRTVGSSTSSTCTKRSSRKDRPDTLTSTEVDDNDRPVVDAKTKLQAATWVSEHAIGKAATQVNVIGRVQVEHAIAAAIILDDGSPQDESVILDGEYTDDEREADRETDDLE